MLEPTSISEQMEILKQRNIILPNKSELILLQYGYYNLINGYKDPFIDIEKTRIIGHDYYKSGTSLSHIVELYKFDAILRSNLLYCIMVVEAQVKSLISLYFSLRFGTSHWDYLTPKSFKTAPDKTKYVNSLISKLQKDIDKFSNRTPHPSISHFMHKYNQIPLWVLNTIMSFGTMSRFYDNLQDDLKNKIAKSINPHLKPKTLSSVLYYLTDIRNKCAHSNRLYIHKIDQRSTRSSMIPILNIHNKLNIPCNKAKTQYQYGQDDILAVILCLSIFFDQTRIFGMNYPIIENSLRALGKNIPIPAMNFIRNVTGLHENILQQLYKIFN